MAGLWQNDPRLRESMQKIRGAQMATPHDIDGKEVILDREAFNEYIYLFKISNTFETTTVTLCLISTATSITDVCVICSDITTFSS